MTTGDRIKQVRRHFGLNQTDFGARIGLSQAAIGGYENNSHNVAEQTLIHISKEYGIVLSWLRTGEGEMIDNRGDEFGEIAKQLNLSAAQLRLVRLVYEMPPEYQDMVLDLARKLVADEEAESDYDRTIRIASAALDEHDRQFEEPRDGEKRA